MALDPSALALSGIQRRFALPASFRPGIVNNGGSYMATLDILADQTGGAFNGTSVAVGYRILTSSQQLYEITDVIAAGFSEVQVEVSEVTDSGQQPSGAALLYQYDGSTAVIPMVPVNSTGISTALSAIIATHNAQITQGEIQAVGGGQPLTEARLRTLAADPTEREVRVDVPVFINADLTLPSHLHLDIRAGGYFQIADAADLEIHGPIRCHLSQFIFRGEGHVTLGRKEAFIEWFGAKGDGSMDPFTFLPLNSNYTPCGHPFRKACVAVGENGLVRSGKGIFVMKEAPSEVLTRWGRGLNITPIKATLSTFLDVINGDKVCWHGITYEGAGKGLSVFVPSGELSDAGETNAGVTWSPYRSAGHLDTAADLASQATYETNLPGGSLVVPLKDAAMAGIFYRGQVIQVRNGGNIWDQDKCEMNIVDRVEGNLLYLKYPIRRDMSIDSASLAGKVGAFTQPVEGGVVQVSYVGNNSKPLGGVDKTFTLANNLFEVVSNDGAGLYTIRNVAGKGNDAAGTEFPADSDVMKARVVYPCTSSTVGATIRDLTVVGVHDGWRFSNMIDCKAINVEMLHSGSLSGGLSIDGDGGANVLMEHCTTRVRSGQFEGAQIARSQTNFISRFSQWIGVKHSVVEFSYGSTFYRDDFYFDARYGEKIDEEQTEGGIIYKPATNIAAMLIGQSTGETRIEGCYFDVQGAEKAIGSSDIVSFTASSGGNCHIINNTFRVDGTEVVITLNGAGHVITGNRMTGSTEAVYGALGDIAATGDLDTVSGVASLTGTLWAEAGQTFVGDCHFVGKVDQIFRSGPKALKVRNSSVTRTGGRLGQLTLDRDRVISGSLVGNNGNNYETYGVDIEMDVHGWYNVAGVLANKFQGVMKTPDKFIFRMYRTQNYTESGGVYTHTGRTDFSINQINGPV